MKQLDVIGELHPLNLVYGVLTNSHYGELFEEKIKDKYFRPKKSRLAFLVGSDTFWENLIIDITERGRQYQNQKKDESDVFDEDPKRFTEAASLGEYPGRFTEAECSRLEELALKQIGIARKIWIYGIRIIEERRPEAVYLERKGPCPLGKLARENGADVVLLDQDNPHYEWLSNKKDMFGGAYAQEWRKDKVQTKREEIWLERICNGGLLIVGCTHVEGKSGLVDGLAKKQMRINMIKDFKEYNESLANIYTERKAIMGEGFERYICSL
jgi:hypothetical protein